MAKVARESKNSFWTSLSQAMFRREMRELDADFQYIRSLIRARAARFSGSLNSQIGKVSSPKIAKAEKGQKSPKIA